MRSRRGLGLALAGALVVTSAAPALAHATFPAAQNTQGSTAPYPAGAVRFMMLRVPEERAGPPKLDNVDVKVDLPEGWASPVCLPARSASGSAPGPAAAGWSCSVEPGTPTVLHWTRASGATTLGIYFPFTALTPATAGTYPFVIHQAYSGGEVVDWKDKPLPPDCTTGTNTAGTACSKPAPTRIVGAPAAKGYWLVASDGGIFAFGDATFLGSTGDKVLNKPIVSMAATPTGKGYWLVASDGGIFAFGDATFLGSTGDKVLNKPIVGMAATPTGKGYWLTASDGGIFAFGDATFLGSTGDKVLNKPIVGMAATPTGLGYWLTASDGGIFAFGDAAFLGSTGDKTLNQPIVAVRSTPSGAGYWLVASDGGTFAFGDATFLGVPEGAKAVIGSALSPTGKGYWLSTSEGKVTNFGDAPSLGSVSSPNKPVVGLAPAS